MKLVFSDEARRDLLAIGDYIARDSPLRARNFVQQLRAKALQLRDMPHAFPLVLGYEKPGLRRFIHRDYVILYRTTSDTVFVVHIVHGARDYAALLSLEGP